MAASSSSSSSFATSSLGYSPAHSSLHQYASPMESSWTTPNTIASDPSGTSGLRELDLGPPGYEATIILWENTADERAIHLGPWQIMNGPERWVEWQCTYELERLEHFFSVEDPVPLTLHSKHRPFHERPKLEQAVEFSESQRIRYIDQHGVVLHDSYIPVRYQFTSVDSSLQFQGDVRNKHVIGYYDVDVVWSDTHPRTDRFGSLKGLGLMHRIKLWRDRYTGLHSLTIYANRTHAKAHQEFEVHWFDVDLGGKDARHKQAKMYIRGPKRDGTTESSARRFSFTRIRPRVRSGHSSPAPSTSESSSAQLNIDFRYIGVQFTHSDDYRHFIDAWALAQQADSDFNVTASRLQVVHEPGHDESGPT